MSYIGTDIATLAQRIMVDISDDAYIGADADNHDMLHYLNEGQRYFASQTHCCQEMVSDNITGNTQTYSTLAGLISNGTEILEAHKILVKDTSKTNYEFLPRAPLTEMRALLATTDSAPERWTIFGETIYFDIHPSDTIDLDMDFFCSYTPNDLAAIGNTILIPDKWVHALVKYVIFCCRAQDRDTGMANGALAEFDNIVDTAKEYYRKILEG